jgi:hypothetical protein
MRQRIYEPALNGHRGGPRSSQSPLGLLLVFDFRQQVVKPGIWVGRSEQSESVSDRFRQIIGERRRRCPLARLRCGASEWLLPSQYESEQDYIVLPAGPSPSQKKEIPPHREQEVEFSS